MRKTLFTLLVALCAAGMLPAQETIVVIRHGEKPAAGLGQLSCTGLNRALALPKLLVSRYGKPDAIYAPNPAQEVVDTPPLTRVAPDGRSAPWLRSPAAGARSAQGASDLPRHEGPVAGAKYAYVRPFVTLEPTAVEYGLPVQIQFGYKDIAQLQAALTAPANAQGVIFVAWEHGELNHFAQQMLKTYGLNPDAVPEWPGDEYDRIYVFRLRRVDGKVKLEFHIEQEGLTGKLSNTCPAG